MEIATPEQLLVLAMVAAAGKGLTVMVTELDLIQPVALLFLSMYKSLLPLEL